MGAGLPRSGNAMAPPEKEQAGELSDSDRMELDELVEERRHRRWFWGVVRRWAAWITAIIVGAPTVWEALQKVWKALK